LAIISFDNALGENPQGNAELIRLIRQLIADAIAGNTGMNLNSVLTGNYMTSGLLSKLTAGTALSFGNVCYVGPDGKMELASNATSATVPAIGIVSSQGILEDGTGKFLLHGFLRDDSSTWSSGGMLYLSTGGALTQTAPAVSGEQIQWMGIAIAANIIYFNPNLVVGEVT